MNLIITCYRFFENEAEEEIKGIIDQVLADKSLEKQERELVHSALEFDDTVIRTVMIPRTKMFTLNSKTTNLEEISSQISKLVGVIAPKETFRITIEKRNSNLSKNEIINKIAKNIPNKVSLNQPDWIVLIEIIGNNTGLAVLRDESILSLQKIKRSLSS